MENACLGDRGGEYLFDRTYTVKIEPSQTLDLKHVEIIKVLDNQTCDT